MKKYFQGLLIIILIPFFCYAGSVFHDPQKLVCHPRSVHCISRFGSRLAGTFYITQTPVKYPHYTICLPFDGDLNAVDYEQLIKRCDISFPFSCNRLGGYCYPKFS